MPSRVPLIQIRKATIWRGRTRVFENLDLDIPQQQSVAIIGPNGSGKTTLLKTINRELYPVAAEGSVVRILGRERWNVWQLRKHIGIVSHDLHARYTGETTGLEVVLSGFLSSIGVHGTLAGRVDEEDTRKATRIMRRLGIDDSASTPLKFLSTGQQRRCLLARALVHEPQTLILDEPTAGLDFSASFDYLRRISDLSQRGCNIVIATHHLNEIPPEVQRVIVLKDGRVVADGSKEQVLCAEVLSDTYEMPVRVARVDGYYLAYPGEHGPAEANRDTR